MAAKVDWRSEFSETQGFVLEFLTTIVFTDTATVCLFCSLLSAQEQVHHLLMDIFLNSPNGSSRLELPTVLGEIADL